MACTHATRIILAFLSALFISAIIWNFQFRARKRQVVHHFPEDKRAKRCAFLFSNNASKDHHEFKHLMPLHNMQYFLSLNNDSGKLCEAFKRDLFPTEVPITAEERDFPLGFILTVYKSINQVARLLRLIYRPQNFYVIHVDRKSPQEFYDAVQEIAKCFGVNVGVVPRNDSVSVIWGDYTVLEQELVAARMLLQMGKWRYFINLTGQELPMKTNLELVLALKMLNGSNIVEATLKHRFKFRIPRHRPSFPVTWLKNSVHVVLLREFVEYMLNDKRAIELQDTLIKYAYHRHPDEQFYGTLAFNPELGAPGACLGFYDVKGVDRDIFRYPGVVRYKIWSPNSCPTKYVRWICILGSQSLPDLIRAPELFANKFHEDYYPEGYSCLEYAIANRSYHGPAHHFDPSIFARLHCSLNHV
ncbi:hypothetical protein AAHC03_026233 [Spirometra sp. Aus1]